MKTYGLIGFPLDHSFSPKYFRKKFEAEGIDARYLAFPLEHIAELPELLKIQLELCGFNVTTPHKQGILPFLDDLSPDAEEIGAVNCVFIDDGRLVGFNTDWRGFRDSLLPLLGEERPQALVLGTGGASQAVQYALNEMGMSFKTVSRDRRKADYCYDDLSEPVIAAHPLIINTTTLGTKGFGLPELPYEAVGEEHLLYDLVYNPPLTPFLQEGLKRGARVQNGYEMLRLQAEAAWEIWQAESGR
jgi:shikimate dehydrogenase